MRFGTSKYHNQLSKRLITFMKKNDFELCDYHGAKYLSKEYPNGYMDLFNSKPTRAEKGKEYNHFLFRLVGPYFRNLIEIEEKVKSLLNESNFSQGTYSTISSKSINDMTIVNQSNEGVKILYDLWCKELYPIIKKELDVFNDKEKLNLVFNYTDKAEKLGLLDKIFVDDKTVKGRIRCLLIAKLVNDTNFLEIQDKYIQEYESRKDGTEIVNAQIDSIIKLIKIV